MAFFNKLLPCVQTLESKSYIYAVTFSPDGKWVAASDNCSVNIWDVTNGTLLYTINTQSIVLCIAFCPAGVRMAIGLSDGNIEIWKVSTGDHLDTISVGTESIKCVSFSQHDGGCTVAITVMQHSTFYILDVDTHNNNYVFNAHSEMINSIAYSPCSNWLVTGSFDKTCKVWDVDTGLCLNIFNVGYCRMVAFSPDGKVIAALNNKQVWVINVSTRAVLLKISMNDNDTNVSLTFVSNWCLLITAQIGYNPYHFNFVGFWDLHTGTCFATLKDQDYSGASIAVSPCGSMLAIASTTNRITILDISSVGSKVIVLTLVLAGRRCRLPHIPQELWELVLDEF